MSESWSDRPRFVDMRTTKNNSYMKIKCLNPQNKIHKRLGTKPAKKGKKDRTVFGFSRNVI
jgi:hypothetical protein